MEKQELAQAVRYFKDRPAFGKLFQKMREKYASLGHLGGNFVLAGLSADEREQLAGFLKKDFAGCDKVAVSYTAMEKALAKSRYSNLSWEEILTAYFGEPLLVKKQERERANEERRAFWKEAISKCQDAATSEWLTSVLEQREGGYRLLDAKYRQDRGGLLDFLEKLFYAFANLPVKSGGTENLAVFAARTAGDPHFFDEDGAANALLYSYIQFCCPDMERAGLSAAEYKERCLYRAGLLKDDLSNMCLIYGVHAVKKDGGRHAGVSGFFAEREPAWLTMRTLSRLTELAAAGDTSGQYVYIVENPAVFSHLISRYPEQTFLCSNGQIRLACYVAMDLFSENVTFYYAGDFDPEGLQIAQRLKERYGERLVLWQYEEEYYYRAMSDVALPQSRLKKLEHIHIPELLAVREAILKEGRAAYQEAMLEVYERL